MLFRVTSKRNGPLPHCINCTKCLRNDRPLLVCFWTPSCKVEVSVSIFYYITITITTYLLFSHIDLVNSKIFRREIDPLTEIPDFDTLLDANNETLTNDDTTLTSLTPENATRHHSLSGISRRKRVNSVGSSASTSGDEQQRPSTVLSMTNTLKRVSQKRSRLRQFYEMIKKNESLMRASGVFSNPDGVDWDWDMIITVLSVSAGLYAFLLIGCMVIILFVFLEPSR